MRWTVLAIFAALVAYLWFTARVALGRKQYGIAAPATTGDPDFERLFRVQQNTVEMLVVFLPAIWMFGTYVSDALAGLLGLGWTAARVLYATRYAADARTRGPGALVSMAITLVLLVGGAAGALLR